MAPERTNPLPGALYALAALVLSVDQITKYLCNLLLSYGEPFRIFPGFDLLLVYNTGAAFSFLSGAGGWQRWILAAISLVVSAVIAVWLARLGARDRLLGIALALVLGGALGNLADRVLLGYVVDFISVYYREYRFATFNLADSAISIGAALMALDLFRGGKSAE